MIKHWPGWLLAGVTVALLGAAPEQAPDLTRQANEAFERQDYDRAVELYTQAEDTTPDPGAVAFNKATALYHQALAADDAKQKARGLREAAGYFGRLTNDPERRGRALYGRANCLLVGQPEEAAALEAAIKDYRACLADPGAAALHADARHNLELAKLLWVKASQKPGNDKQAKKPDDKGTGNDDPNDPKNDPKKQQPMQGTGENGPGKVKPSDKGKPMAVDPMKGQEPKPSEELPPPGSGPDGRVPESDQAVTMSPEDAARHLERAAKKIQEDRRLHRIRTAPKLPETVKDW